MSDSASIASSRDQQLQHQQLLEEVRSRIAQLQAAIQRVGKTKKQLQANAHQAKAEIQWSISRQLEVLRSREVWLLQQVELIQQAKEDVLRQQKDKLNCALGGLNSYLLGRDGETGIDKSVKLSLERSDQLPLYPEETASVSFQADTAALRTAVLHFGKVDSRTLPMELVFADHDSQSASLPKPFEDYEDEEHHVLYKTVQDLKPVGDRVIDVKIPKLSESTLAWLHQPDQSTVPAADSVPDAFLFPPFKAELGDWLTRQGAPASESLHQWLQELKQEADLEEDDFEILSSVDSSSVSQMPTESPSTGSLSNQDATSTYFQMVDDAPASQWLLNEQTSALTYPYQTMGYFTEMAHSTKDWLLSLENSGKQQCGSGSTTAVPASDIEDLLQAVVTHYFQEVSCDPATWLLPLRRDEDADVDEAKPVPGCRANEPCRSLRDCLRDDQCCQDLTASPILQYMHALAESNMADWLLDSSTASVTVTVEVFPPFVSGTTEISQWLCKSGQDRNPTTITTCPFQKHFREISTAFDKDWLIAPAPGQASPRLSALFLGVEFSHSTTDSNKWLLGSEPLSEDTPSIRLCTYEPVEDKEMGFSSGSSTVSSEWILQEWEEEKTDVPKVSEVFSRSSDKNAWLLYGGKEAECSSSDDLDGWLLKSGAPPAEGINLFACFADKSIDTATWLLPTGRGATQ